MDAKHNAPTDVDPFALLSPEEIQFLSQNPDLLVDVVNERAFLKFWQDLKVNMNKSKMAVLQKSLRSVWPHNQCQLELL